MIRIYIRIPCILQITPTQRRKADPSFISAEHDISIRSYQLLIRLYHNRLGKIYTMNMLELCRRKGMRINNIPILHHLNNNWTIFPLQVSYSFPNRWTFWCDCRQIKITLGHFAKTNSLWTVLEWRRMCFSDEFRVSLVLWPATLIQ